MSESEMTVPVSVAANGRRSPVGWAAATLHAEVPRLGHVPHFDGLRGILVFPVLWVHYTFSDFGGQLVVDMFFAMSGYLITTLLLEERERSGRISIRAFYERRAVRLIPELVVCLGVQVALALVGIFPYRTTLVEAFGAFFYVYPLVGDFIRNADQMRMTHYWSLTLEEWYYALWAPMVAGLMVKTKPRAPFLWIAAIGGSLAMLVLHGLAWRSLGPVPQLGLRPETLVLGSCAALLRRDLLAARGRGEPRRWDQPLYAATPAFLAILAAAWLIEPARWFLWPVGMVLACISVVSLSCGREIRPIEWLYTRRLVGKVGSACYAIYIWHMVPFVLINGESAYEAKRHAHPWWITLPVSTLITVAIGLASTEFIAIPARKLYVARKHR